VHLAILGYSLGPNNLVVFRLAIVAMFQLVSSRLVFITLLVARATAASRNCSHACFTSFGQCVDNGGICTFGENSYPYLAPGARVRSFAIFTNHNYTIEYQGADPVYPLRFSWHFPTSELSDLEISEEIRWSISE
jgi:hypothetical protein